MTNAPTSDAKAAFVAEAERIAALIVDRRAYIDTVVIRSNRWFRNRCCQVVIIARKPTFPERKRKILYRELLVATSCAILVAIAADGKTECC